MVLLSSPGTFADSGPVNCKDVCCMLDSETQENRGCEAGRIAELRGGRVLSILLIVRSVLLSMGREGHTEPMTLILSSRCSFTYHVVYHSPPTTLSAYQCIEYSILSPSNHPQHPHTVPKQEFSFPFLFYRQ